MTYRNQFLHDTDDAGGATPAEPQSVQEAISANPDRYQTPADDVTTEPVQDEGTEAVAEPASTEPATEATEPATEATEPATEATEPATEATEPSVEDPYADYGGKETLEQAYRMYQAAQTEEGTVQLLLETAGQLGIGYDQIVKLFELQDEANAAETKAEGYDYEDDPDRPLTAAEFAAWQKEQSEKAAEAQKQQAIRNAYSEASTIASETVRSLGLEVPTEDSDEDVKTVYDTVMAMGQRYFNEAQAKLAQGVVPADEIRNAIRRGHADYQTMVERARRDYVEKKKAAADSVPSSPAGSAAPSSEPPAEPKDMDEAVRLARDRFKAAGIM